LLISRFWNAAASPSNRPLGHVQFERIVLRTRMPAVERKPENSAIEEVVDGDPLTLRWNQPNQPAHGLLIGYSIGKMGKMVTLFVRRLRTNV
jgi:hypothetical protein